MGDEQAGRSFKVWLAEQQPPEVDEPSAFWTDDSGTVFRLYRIFYVAAGTGDRWIALRVGGGGITTRFPNESQADARETWQAAVTNLRPLGDAIKITIMGPEWSDKKPASDLSDEEIKQQLLSAHPALKVTQSGGGWFDAQITRPGYCFGLEFWKKVSDLGLEILHVVKEDPVMSVRLRRKDWADRCTSNKPKEEDDV